MGYGAGTSPVGGGNGYPDILPSVNAVSNRAELLSALSGASSGQVVYVDDNAEIDLTDHYGIVIPDGVTLASGRGRTAGALLYSSQTHGYVGMLRPGNDTRITGLRIRGPNSTTSGGGGDYGIWSESHHGLVVDNCEVYNWRFSAIAYFYDSQQGFASGAWIHHNHIHHNQLLGLGYGVAVAQAWATIEANLFDYGRHFIMGVRSHKSAGTPANYEARYNIFGPHCTHTLVDCHGGNDPYTEGSFHGPDPDWEAGGTLLIHHNTFQNSDRASVKPRGVPRVECRVYQNWTFHVQSGAFVQEVNNLGLTPYVNMSVYDNWYGPDPPPDNRREMRIEVEVNQC